MKKPIAIATTLFLLLTSTTYAQEARPHLFDDLNDNGISDSDERMADQPENTEQSQETVDLVQPTDEGGE